MCSPRVPSFGAVCLTCQHTAAVMAVALTLTGTTTCATALSIGSGPADPASSDAALPLRLSLALRTPPPTSRVDTAPASTLAELLQAASQAAPNRAADAQAQAADALHDQAWATAWMPRLDASASSSRQQQTYNGLDSHTPASVTSLTASLPLWRAADRANAHAQAALAEQAWWQARGQRVALARELSLAYVAAAQAAEGQRLTQAQLDLLQAQQVINDKRLRAGVGTVLEQLETRTRMDQARARLREFGMRARTQQLLLERVCGQPVRIPAGLSVHDTPLLDAASEALPSQEEALQQASQRNPQWRDTHAEVDAAQATTRARDAEYWQPTLDASASTTRARQTQRFEGLSESQDIRTQAIGVQLNWPLFTGGYQQARTREAAALLIRSQARQDDTEAQVRQGLLDAYQSLAQAQAQSTDQREIELTAMATYEAIHKAFLAGTRTNLDLLDAQQQIYTARQNLVAARASALNARIQILALLDWLDAAHVAPLSAQFAQDALPSSASTP